MGSRSGFRSREGSGAPSSARCPGAKDPQARAGSDVPCVGDEGHVSALWGPGPEGGPADPHRPPCCTYAPTA